MSNSDLSLMASFQYLKKLKTYYGIEIIIKISNYFSERLLISTTHVIKINDKIVLLFFFHKDKLEWGVKVNKRSKTNNSKT